MSQGFRIRGSVVISRPPAVISKGTFPRIRTPARPKAEPTAAPMRPRRALSTRKISLISDILAPMAMSMPISLVFSTTRRFMMLATPKKATTMKSRTENLVQKPPMFMACMISGFFSCQLMALYPQAEIRPARLWAWLMSCSLISTAFITSPSSRKLRAVSIETKTARSSSGVPVLKIPVTVNSVPRALGKVAAILSPSFKSRDSARV